MNSKILYYSATLVCALFMSGHKAYAQAFGIEVGTPLSEFATAKNIGSVGNYEVEVPRPHPEFEFYAVKVSDQTGVCVVSGIGKMHQNDRYGRSVQTAFDGLVAALEERYGSYDNIDVIAGNALWDDTDEWVMSIQQNERMRASIWGSEDESDLPDSLQHIILEIGAQNSSVSYLTLTYTFTNLEECDEVIDSVNRQGL